MISQEMKDRIRQGMDNLPSSSTSIQQAEDLAGFFLVIQHEVEEYLLELEMKQAEEDAVSKHLYSNAIFKADGKNATEKEAHAKANKEYTDSITNLKKHKAASMYCRSVAQIFKDAHLTARAMMKEK